MSTITIPKPELIQVGKLRVDGENPNRMTPKQIARLKSSIQKYGFIVPIITNKDLLVADGEQRLTVAKSINMLKVPVIKLNVKDVDRRLLRQVLNKLRGEHDLVADAYEFEKIIQQGHEDELKHLLDLSDSQIERYLTEIHEPKPEDYDIPEIDKIQTSIQRGDVYKLGVHRLMCGDATTKEDVSRLMNGKKADMVFTDPPYNVGVKYESYEDNLPLEKYVQFCHNWLALAKEYNKGTTLITCGVKGLCRYWLKIIEPDWIIAHLLSNGQSNTPLGGTCKWSPVLVLDPKITKNIDIVEANTDIDYLRTLPIPLKPKPIALMAKLIPQFCKHKDGVLDLFGGSGSTLIACEQTGRQCYMMEIDPRYCQIIINRWESYTKQKATKLN